VHAPSRISSNFVPPLIAFPEATGLVKIHGDLMIVVYWISINGSCPGRRVSTAICGTIVVTMSDDGKGDLDGSIVVGMYEGAIVGTLLGEADGPAEGNCVGKFTEGVKVGIEEGDVKVGNAVGTTLGVLLGLSVVGEKDG